MMEIRYIFLEKQTQPFLYLMFLYVMYPRLAYNVSLSSPV